MATFSYFYTLSVKTDYEEYFDTAEQGSVTQEQWYQWDDLTDMVHEEHRPTGGTSPVNGIYTGPATELAPYATTIKVKKLMKVTYYARFYMKEVDGSTTKYYWLNDNGIKNVKVTAAGSKFVKISGVTTLEPGDKGWAKSKYPGVLGVTSGHCFVFTMSVKEANFTLANPFTITAEITPSDFGYGGSTPNPSSTKVTIANSNIAGLNPTIKSTQAQVAPAPNSNFLDALRSTTQASGYYTWPTTSANAFGPNDVQNFQFVYAYDACTKDTKKAWIGVKWGSTISADRKKKLLKYTVMYGSKDGQGFNADAFKPKFEEMTKNKTNITSPGLEKILDIIIAARVSNCASASSGGGGGGGGDDGSKDTVIVRPVPPKGDLRWNPPPHIEARGVNFSHRLSEISFVDESGNTLQLQGAELQENLLSLYGTRMERGRIFQDKVTAKVMNTTKLSVVSKKADVLQWGYEFMYNPETIDYQTTDGSGIDWTYGSKDKAVVLSGSQTFSFELLINRIPDMGFLKNVVTPDSWGSNTLSVAGAYGRGLEDEEIQGILRRGTEYDIEFLYRVLTGDPMPNSLLLAPGYAKTALTADIGYITKVPVWLFLHNNMRLFGSIASISVRHRIFDQNMVPMLSRMSVSFTRYPAYAGKAPNTKSTASTTGN
jgi:hypothetical protein